MESKRRQDKHGTRRKRGKGKVKKKHPVLKTIGLLILFLIVIIGITFGKAYLDVKKASAKSYQPIKRTTQAKMPVLTEKTPFSFLFLGVNGKSVNDILVLTVNPEQNKTTVISLNRDIYLLNEATTLKALYEKEGISGAIDTLQKLLGTDIPKYMTFDMSGLGDFVSAVGGVKVQNDTHFISSGYEFKPGTLYLSKEDEVKAYLTKVGEDNNKAESMLIDREQALLIAIIPKLKSVNTILKYPKFINAFSNNIKTDFGFNNIKSLGLDYHSVLANITKENLKPTKTTIDGVEQKILSEDQINKAHDRIQSALSE